MLKCELIGYLGADAQVVEYEGRKFVACRVADSDSWKDRDGVRHERTRWIDVVVNNYEGILPYLKKSTLVFVRGDVDLRVFSSPKDKCMKCGATVRAAEVKLLSAARREEHLNDGATLDEHYDGF